MLETLFATRYLLSKQKSSVVRVIALLTVAGIGIGVLAMIVVLSVMTGFDDAIKTRLLGAEPHLVISASSKEDLSKIQKIVGDNGKVERATRQDIIVRTVDGIFSGAVAQGKDAEAMQHSLKQVQHRVEVDDTGSTDSAAPDANSKVQVATSKTESHPVNFVLQKKEVAVGADLARSLGIFEGDELTIVAPESLLLPAGEMPIYERVKVRALVRTDVSDIDAHTLFFNLSSGLKRLQDTASLERVVEVRLNHPSDAPQFSQLLKSQGFSQVKTWQELNSALFYSLKMEKTLMGIFLGLTLLVSSFSIVAVLFLLVTEKREDVGILRALGARQNQIRKIFLTIGLGLSGAGIFGGTILGLIVCWALKTFPFIHLPDIYYDTTIPVHVEKGAVCIVILLGLVLSVLSALLPANQIAQCTPIDALRRGDG